ncbi:hypothetical protein MBLNU459_g8277t1 [Dothideomycetes sp. NU459]
MCGYIAGVVLQNASSGGVVLVPPSKGNNQTGSLFCDGKESNLMSLRCSLNWRLMLASPMILPLVVVAYIYTLPESPRWLLRRAQLGDVSKYEKAFLSLCQLRHTKLQAARDMFLISYQLREEQRIRKQQKPFLELFTVARNRRAFTASVIVMFFQQFCGVNVLAYYSSTVLLGAGFSPGNALAASMGFGIINFVFALPAFWTIDSFGRRNLLLSTFPFMALFQLLIAIAFAATELYSHVQTGLVLLGMYLFAVFYSPGEGPVPFVYAAESMPLYNRDIGMGIVTSINWLFNGLLAFTWPFFEQDFHWWGAFLWYAMWCVIGEIAILLAVPETKDLSLEQLADVFNVPSRQHALHGLREAAYFVRRHILRRKRVVRPVLLKKNDEQEPEQIEMY